MDDYTYAKDDAGAVRVFDNTGRRIAYLVGRDADRVLAEIASARNNSGDDADERRIISRVLENLLSQRHLQPNT